MRLLDATAFTRRDVFPESATAAKVLPDDVAAALSGETHPSRGPTFSFVATSRNDDHGGDALRRTQSFVNGLALQCERHQVRGELVLVDWNPPTSRLPLADVLSWPAGSEWFTAKVVTVPHEVHLRLPNARSLTMFQMIAKNVGLRRASGRFGVATNIDILFSDELMRWLKAGNLRDGAIYRSDRWDIPNDIQLEPDFDTLLAHARADAIRHNRLEGTWDVVDGVLVEPALKRVDHMLLYPIQHSLEHVAAALDRGEDVRPRIERLLSETLPTMRRFYMTPATHLNGCGDFTLMSASSWDELRGYPEWPVFSWNIDSITLIHAVCSGFEHVEAPRDAVHFHIEHSYGSGYTPQGADSLWRRMQQRDIAVINAEDFRSLALDMEEDFRSRRPIIFNETDWGMAEADLPVTVTAWPGSPRTAPSVPSSDKLIENFDTHGLSNLSLPLLDADLTLCEHVDLGWVDGRVTALLRLPANHYGYGVVWSSKDLWPRDRNVWLRFFCRIDEGAASLGVLSKDEKAFTHEVTALQAGDGRREITMLLPPMPYDPKFVLRNRGAPHSRVEISDIELFWEGQADRAHGLAAAAA